MADALHVESLDKLIKAFVQYQESLVTNTNILVNAANLCDQAMGSDDIVQKYIARLERAVTNLKKATETAEDIETVLRDFRKRAVIDIYENV